MPVSRNAIVNQPINQTGNGVAFQTVNRATHAGIRRRIPTNTSQAVDIEDENAASSLGTFARITAYGCVALFAVSALLLTGATYFGDSLARAGHSPSTERLEIVLANQVLQVPANSVRFPKQRKSSVQPRLDLYLHWPTMSGYTDTLGEIFNDAGDETDIIFVTIEPRNMSFDMSGRLEPIYSMFMEGAAEPALPGLVKKTLSPKGGFIDEDLYFQKNSPYPFVTRCIRDNSPIGTPFCIRDIHLGHDLMVTYRFHKELLNDWISLEEAIRAYTKSLLVSKTAVLKR